MPPSVELAINDGVALIHINNPPVNALSAGVSEGLRAAIEDAEGRPDVRALVIAGAGKTFIAGADIQDLEHAAWSDAASAPDFHDLLQCVEDCRKPVVMAIHGMALGGGLEFAMAGHYRVATADAQMGQPEVNLGIIPGAEGTQRLPRLVGVEKAIELCVTGKPMSAGEASRLGLIDRIVDQDLVVGAAAFAREIAARPGLALKTRNRVDRLGTPESAGPLLTAGRALARKSRRNQTAPLAAVDAIEAAVTLPFDQGCIREREISLRCLRSEQCKALVHAFFAERAAARVPEVPRDARFAEIRRVAIIGAGTMGAGIAMACANAGIPVTLADAAGEALDRGLATIRRNYDASLKRGRLTPDAVERRLGLIQPARDSRAAVAEADLVIEAVFENMAVKRDVFADLDRAARPDAILATNTSTLDIDAIASATGRPASVIGLHFFSPANVMRLIEVVRGSATSPEVLGRSLALAKRLGKAGVVVRNAPAFVGNRMMFPYMYEAQFLVEEGATPERVDRVLTDFGMAMGIFAVDDLGGLDVAWRVRRELHQFEKPGMRKPLVADKLVEMGRLGQKAGRGWYRYNDGRTPTDDPEVAAVIESVTAAADIPRHNVGEEEIFERTVYALINEGARVLDEGVALRASDIDVIYMNGYGFPTYRGGPMFYADRVGLGRICDRVTALHREHGDRWRPAPLLERLARDGKTFREFDAAR
jgi:3-hydroxyacyl-CoA dehydrogenase